MEMLDSKPAWLVLALVFILAWIGTPREGGAQQDVQSSYRLQTWVMSAAGSPGAGVSSRGNGSMSQPTPIGVGSSSGKTVYAGFWSRPWVLASVLHTDGLQPLTNCIYQNFPNPFTQTTEIAYSVARLSMVEVAVYNVEGRRVRTIVSEYASPGRYVTGWDGRSDTGAQASPGVYFCRMSVADYRSAKKMLFLR
jgi:hypothetical protein